MKDGKSLAVHPGRILRETLFPEAGITVAEAAEAMEEPLNTLLNILAEQAPLTAALSLKIAKLFDSYPELWIRLQSRYDLEQAIHDEALAQSLERIVPALPRRKPVTVLRTGSDTLEGRDHTRANPSVA